MLQLGGCENLTKQNFQEFCDEKILALIFPLLFLDSYLKHSHMHENLFLFL